MINAEVKNCWNCKHEKVSILAEPCYACIKKGQRVNWESTTTIIKKEEVMMEICCSTCVHERLGALAEPCRAGHDYVNHKPKVESKKEEEEKSCVSCKHNSYESLCGSCGDDNESRGPIGGGELTCNGCKHAGKTAFDMPCSECIRRKKDLFEAKPKQLVKKTYYFTSWVCATDKDVRVFTPGYLDKSRVFTPDHKFTKHVMEIEEEG